MKKITIPEYALTEPEILTHMLIESGVNLSEIFDSGINYTLKFEYQINSAPVLNTAKLQILDDTEILAEIEADC